MTKLSDETKKAMVIDADSGLTIEQLSEKYFVDRKTVFQVCHGRLTRKRIGRSSKVLRWKFKERNPMKFLGMDYVEKRLK